MAGNAIRNIRQRLSLRRIALLGAAAIVAVLLTAFIRWMPKFEVLDAAIDDDNFTDLVQQTRGDLAIDTNIRVLTYDESILDSFDLIDRATLAMQLAALMELEPRVVGVDFLIETERPEAPNGDEMLAGLIAGHPNLIFGIFHEDSLHRFRIPPPRFNLAPGQLGCINVMEDDDNTIRTFTTLWGEEKGPKFESFDVKIARWIDTGAVAYLHSFNATEFVINYAAGIGETRRTTDNGGALIFPVMPLRSIFSTLMSGDTAAIAFLRSQFAGKAVLVGYGDIGNTQVTRIVDRFYTPLREDDRNMLPDMHGVAIHANILNTILQQRIVRVMPLWINLIWGMLIVMVMLAGRETLHAVAPTPSRRTALSYAGFVLLFLLGTLLPVLAFRFTPWKFSIYTPLAGLLLAVPSLEGLETAIGVVRDMRRRRRLRAPLPPASRTAMRDILRAWNPEERMERAVHFLQLQFHSACVVLFHEAARLDMPAFSRATIAAPNLRSMLDTLEVHAAELAAAPVRARRAMELLRAIAADPLLAKTLRFSRSLYIAMNEIRRQSHDMPTDPNELNGADDPEEFRENVGDYADLALKALGKGGGRETVGEFDALYAALERYVLRSADVPRDRGGDVTDLLEDTADLHPYILSCRCQLHDISERFVYFEEQEDANNRDDFFDLVYAGRTIRCQPDSHPGLGRFRQLTAPSIEAPEQSGNAEENAAMPGSLLPRPDER